MSKKKLSKDQRRKKVMQKRLQRQIKWDAECWRRHIEERKNAKGK